MREAWCERRGCSARGSGKKKQAGDVRERRRKNKKK
jgi:hypothetical protein